MVFFKSLICFALVFAIASTQGKAIRKRIVRQAPYAGNYANIEATAYNQDFDPNTGSFSYGYQQNDGSDVNAKGYLNQNGNQVIEGSYAYADPAGSPVQIQYVADENGYQAVGDAIPQADPVIAKAVAYLKSLPPSPENYYQQQ